MKNTPDSIFFAILLCLPLILSSPKFSLAQNKETLYNEPVIAAETPAPADEYQRNPFIPLIDENNKLRRDFRKPQTAEIALKAALSGICRIQNTSYAIIDGELLKEGDMFQEFLIEKINPDSVSLRLKDVRFTLQLEPKQATQDEE